MSQPTEQAVAAALALVDALTGDKSVATMTDSFATIRHFLRMGENEFTAAARILAAAYREAMAEVRRLEGPSK